MVTASAPSVSVSVTRTASSALVGTSPIILADEPTANLDFHAGQQVLELFRQLAKQENRALLIVTHDPRVRAITDRTVLIRDGVLYSEEEVPL
jgi:putative ABC transport system ATP-binding protein